ncbi:MAG: hypothetical protein HYU66_04690 [Armatimonadetes bacterium]|nr:hypothetical protein [Armatimonadota bacterium]
MTSRDRWLATLAHEEPDRIPIADVLWVTTIERWHREGLPADQSPHSFFGYEWHGQGADLSFQLPVERLVDNDDHCLERDAFGAVTKVLKGRESVPEYHDWTITSRSAWEEYKPRLAWNDQRVDLAAAVAANRQLREQGQFVIYAAGFGYDRIQRFVGIERTLAAIAGEFDWVLDMMETVADTVIAGAEALVSAGCRYDAAFIWNDQAYRNGPFFSPATHRVLELPSQRRMCDWFHQHGMKVILHSDGDIRPLIPNLLEAGFDCLQPCEVKAGMDLVELKAQWGDRLSFMGGIDVRAMAHPDPAVIVSEIRRKIPVAKRGGGYIYHSDHSVPDNVSWAQYLRVMELVREYGRYG